MANVLILGSGFDAFATADLTTIFSTVSATINTNTTHTPFNTGRSLSIINQSAVFTPPAATDSLIVGLYYKNLTASTINGTLIQFRQGGSDQLCIRWQTGNTGKLEIRRGGSAGTLLDTTSSAVATDGVFVHIEVRIKISTSIASGDVVISVNGADVLTLASTTNTRNTSTSSVDEIRICDSNGSMYIDDLFIHDWSTGSGGRIGKARFYPIRPNGDGASSDFVGSDGNSVNNYALVNSAPFASGSYVEGSTAGQVDVYDFENLSVTPATIHAVIAHFSVQAIDAGQRTVRPVLRIGGTLYDTGTDVVPSLSFMTRSAIFSTNPAGGSWSAGTINSMQAGLKLFT